MLLADLSWTLLRLLTKMIAAAAVVWTSGLERGSSIVLVFVGCWEKAMAMLMLSLVGSLQRPLLV